MKLGWGSSASDSTGAMRHAAASMRHNRADERDLGSLDFTIDSP
jgi:hypothetical protein